MINKTKILKKLGSKKGIALFILFLGFTTASISCSLFKSSEEDQIKDRLKELSVLLSKTREVNLINLAKKVNAATKYFSYPVEVKLSFSENNQKSFTAKNEGT